MFAATIGAAAAAAGEGGDGAVAAVVGMATNVAAEPLPPDGDECADSDYDTSARLSGPAGAGRRRSQTGFGSDGCVSMRPNDGALASGIAQQTGGARKRGGDGALENGDGATIEWLNRHWRHCQAPSDATRASGCCVSRNCYSSAGGAALAAAGVDGDGQDCDSFGGGARRRPPNRAGGDEGGRP